MYLRPNTPECLHTFSMRSRHSALSIQSIASHWTPSLLARDTNNSNLTVWKDRSCVCMCIWFWKSAPVVLQLLQGEDVLVEVLLKFLVSVVDVKLFKSIHLEAETPVSQTHTSLVPTC